MTAGNDMARLWLARSLAATAPALRALADDLALQLPIDAIGGFEPPTPPTPAELHAAAGVVERAASCLRHAAGGAWI